MSASPDPPPPPTPGPGAPGQVDPARELLWLRRLRDLSHRLARETDVRALLPLILDAAIELTLAERGFLVRVDGRARGPEGRPKIKVEVARGFDQESLAGAQGKVSRTVVERVLEQRRGLVTTSEQDADLTQVSSVQARRVLAILCVPLLVRGEPAGVLYLDHRFSPTAFSEQDLPVVAAFADQAALALETAELQAARAQAERPRPAPGPEVAPPPLALARPAGAPMRFGRLVGGSQAMRALHAEVERAARADGPVLITGEAGTGKELVARELHARGPRPAEPFLGQACAALADAQLESELFGHRRGALPGAVADRRGLLAQAGRGTVFLDEVADLPPPLQARLLRVLQEGAVRPLGADAPQPIACRIVAATRHDLRALVEAGRFREDLYYRLDVLRLAVPPLRARLEDVPALLAHFLHAHHHAPLEVTDKALELLLSYSWPGNVRELENEARRLAALGEPKLTARHLSPDVAAGKGLTRVAGAYAGKTLADVEREMLVAALAESGGNKARAARQLGIPKTTLYHLLERYELK